MGSNHTPVLLSSRLSYTFVFTHRLMCVYMTARLRFFFPATKA